MLFTAYAPNDKKSLFIAQSPTQNQAASQQGDEFEHEMRVYFKTDDYLTVRVGFLVFM
jgi:hypothetical protein